MAGRVIQGLGRLFDAIPQIMYPGLGASGVDPQIARQLQAQAMMQMGAGLVGGQDLGQAYGLGQVAANRGLDQYQQQQYMNRQADWRKEDQAYREKRDAEDTRRWNRTKMLGRMDREQAQQNFEQEREEMREWRKTQEELQRLQIRSSEAARAATEGRLGQVEARQAQQDKYAIEIATQRAMLLKEMNRQPRGSEGWLRLHDMYVGLGGRPIISGSDQMMGLGMGGGAQLPPLDGDWQE